MLQGKKLQSRKSPEKKKGHTGLCALDDPIGTTMADAQEGPPPRLDSTVLQQLLEMDGIAPTSETMPPPPAVVPPMINHHHLLQQDHAAMPAPFQQPWQLAAQQHLFAAPAAFNSSTFHPAGAPLFPQLATTAPSPITHHRKYFKYHMQRLQTTANHVLFYVSLS